MGDFNISSSLITIPNLQSIRVNLFSIGGPILIIIGTISCIVNLLVFHQKKLRKNPCALCFMAFNISSLLLLYLSFLPAVLQIGFNIEPGAYNLPYCRLRYYLGFLFACLPPFYLILASIDRTLITSSNVNIRQWSNCSFIYRCLFGITLFWMLFHSHAFVYIDIVEFEQGYSVCYFQRGLYSVLVSYYTLIVNGIIPLVLLSTFTILTMRNLHRRVFQNVITAEMRTIHISHRQDRQLTGMLLIEIFTCIIFDFIHPCVLLIVHISQYQIHSNEYQEFDRFLLSISTFSLHIPFCTSLYTNLMVSKRFRKQVKYIIFRKKMRNRTLPA
ncbi:hypothetical protein I4U23_019865 [Adineta vaga]|nr:hypothetical protein I4U23_019865 [Adineta vaga]